MSAKEFEGFATHRVAVHSQCLGKELEIFCRKRGSGPGLLLLHGFPQNNQYVLCAACVHTFEQLSQHLAQGRSETE